MKNNNRKRLLEKIAFIDKNKELCNKAFSKYYKHEDWRKPDCRKLLAKYKKKLKFSDKTGNLDIFHTLYRFWKTLKELK